MSKFHEFRRFQTSIRELERVKSYYLYFETHLLLFISARLSTIFPFSTQMLMWRMRLHFFLKQVRLKSYPGTEGFHS